MNADQLDWLTERVLGAVFEVTNTPGAGFLEKVYQRALLRELGLRGIRAVAEASFTVTRARAQSPLVWRLFDELGNVVDDREGNVPGLAVFGRQTLAFTGHKQEIGRASCRERE